MPKEGRTDAQWRAEFIKLARDNTQSLRGKKPPGNTKNSKTYDKIVACPRWKNMFKSTGTQMNLFNQPIAVDKCNCGYEQYHGVEATVTTAVAAAATQQAHPPPPIYIPFNIPKKPDPVTGKGSKGYIKDVIKIQKQKGKFDLLIFGPTWGKCPHCGGRDICDTNVNGHVKTIRTLNQPRFVQGMGMKCNSVNSKPVLMTMSWLLSIMTIMLLSIFWMSLKWNM